ncbi:Abi family protein [Mobiluncus mulieris]|uniref:Abi family protein n=1 Tax=Mobiluncus mulieris TaxID=2052 RepID=A0A7Y0UVE8_9ACTO|nr:Abi family protein [Mobiluncus mulieris]NMX04489.1 Abi family protein [Mobiluncus mulieris]
MSTVKQFFDYTEQVAHLISRGMVVENPDLAKHQLTTLSYYRLSGYWHSMRMIDSTTGTILSAFRPGASFELVLSLYAFDEQLRQAIYADLAGIELAMRALLGHELGKIDPLIHLDEDNLGAPAHQHRGRLRTDYQIWLDKYQTAVAGSREEFVLHHQEHYGGLLPIWAAVEIMDWGMLSRLYRMAPTKARNEIADVCHLRAPQLESWLKSLNIVRNRTAHHSRVFNRVFDIKPKLPDDACFDDIRGRTNRVFAQLTLIRYLQRGLGVMVDSRLFDVLQSYPDNPLIPFERLGAPANWKNNELWMF